MTTTATAQFLAEPLQFAKVDRAQIAYRKFGEGPALILLHGFPLSSLSYRHLVPHLAHHFTCYALDTPGLGASEWHSDFDFHFPSQARTVRQFVDTLGVQSYTVLGHDSGATLARLLCLSDPARVERLILLNTEMPGHRPPLIPLYTALARIPGSMELLRPLTRWRPFLLSRATFGDVFVDRNDSTTNSSAASSNPSSRTADDVKVFAGICSVSTGRSSTTSGLSIASCRRRC